MFAPLMSDTASAMVDGSFWSLLSVIMPTWRSMHKSQVQPETETVVGWEYGSCQCGWHSSNEVQVRSRWSGGNA